MQDHKNQDSNRGTRWSRFSRAAAFWVLNRRLFALFARRGPRFLAGAVAMSALAPTRAASNSVKILAERIASSQQDEIVQRGVLKLHLTLDGVVNDRLTVQWAPEAHGVGPVGVRGRREGYGDESEKNYIHVGVSLA